MDIQAIISQLAVLFIIIALGFVSSKFKALPPDTGKILTKVVLNITVPCTMLNSVIGGNLEITGGAAAFYMLMSLLALLVTAAIAIPASRLIGKAKADKGVYASLMLMANSGFMGFPMAQAVFGPESTFYVALNLIPFHIISFSLGVMLISGKSKFDLSIFRSPTMIASICVIPLALIGFTAPKIVIDAVSLIGGATTPCSMLVIGFTLGQVALRGVFTEWRLYAATLIKLVAIPVAVWLVLSRIPMGDLMRGVLVLVSSMPTAAIVAMFAIEHGGNQKVASGGIFLTTLLSGVTMPIIVYLLLI